MTTVGTTIQSVRFQSRRHTKFEGGVCEPLRFGIAPRLPLRGGVAPMDPRIGFQRGEALVHAVGSDISGKQKRQAEEGDESAERRDEDLQVAMRDRSCDSEDDERDDETRAQRPAFARWR